MDSEQEDKAPPPVPPSRPGDEDCCHGGCDRCVFDLYEEARERYEAALRAWETRHRSGRTPQQGFIDLIKIANEFARKPCE